MKYFSAYTENISIEGLRDAVGSEFIDYLHGFKSVKKCDVLDIRYLVQIAERYSMRLLSNYEYDKYKEFSLNYNKYVLAKIRLASDSYRFIHAKKCSSEAGLLGMVKYESIQDITKLNNYISFVLTSHHEFAKESFLKEILIDAIQCCDCEVYQVQEEVNLGVGRVDLAVYKNNKMLLCIELKRGALRKKDYYQAYEYKKASGIETILIGSCRSDSTPDDFRKYGIKAYKTSMCFPIIDGITQSEPSDFEFRSLGERSDEFEKLIRFLTDYKGIIEIPYTYLCRDLAKRDVCLSFEKVNRTFLTEYKELFGVC